MIGALGELAGAAAVVVSLVYLARQVRMSNRLAQAEAWRNPVSDLNSLNATFGSDPAFGMALFRILDGSDGSDLDDGEATRVMIYLISVANIYEQLFREVRDGVLDGRALAEFTGSGVFDLPFLRANWAQVGPRLGQPFVEYVTERHGLPLLDARADGGHLPKADAP